MILRSGMENKLQGSRYLEIRWEGIQLTFTKNRTKSIEKNAMLSQKMRSSETFKGLKL